VLQVLATVYGSDTEAALGLGSGSEFTLVSTLGVLVSHENSSKRQIACLHRPYTPPPTTPEGTCWSNESFRAYPGDPAGRQSGASITAITFLNDGEK